MTDYVITAGRSEGYPKKHYGAHFVGTRATFCETEDLRSPDANVLAMPNAPVTSLTADAVSVGAEFFGMHVKQRANDTASGVEYGTVRSHDLANGKARWQYIETSDNVWNFSDIDDWVHANEGRDIVFTLFGTPAWASARPTEEGAYGPFNLGIQAEPADMTKWDRFCAKVATRYLGRIKYYEVWNEPNYQNNGATTSGSEFFFSGTFAKLSEMVRRANQAIKAVDPTAQILSPSLTSWTTTANGSAETYFTGMMSASDGASGTMKDWIDIVAVHLYFGSDITKLPKIIDRIDVAKTTAGVSGKETWDTESAPTSPDIASMTNAVAERFMGRSMVIKAAKGIARTIYYQLDHATMGFIDRSVINTHWGIVRALLMGGSVLSASILSDGRVVYHTSTGATTI